MSRIIVSAALPAPLAQRVRTIADHADRSVSYTLGKLLEQALENDNGPAASEAVAKTGEDAPDACAD